MNNPQGMGSRVGSGAGPVDYRNRYNNELGNRSPRGNPGMGGFQNQNGGFRNDRGMTGAGRYGMGGSFGVDRPGFGMNNNLRDKYGPSRGYGGVDDSSRFRGGSAGRLDSQRDSYRSRYGAGNDFSMRNSAFPRNGRFGRPGFPNQQPPFMGNRPYGSRPQLGLGPRRQEESGLKTDLKGGVEVKNTSNDPNSTFYRSRSAPREKRLAESIYKPITPTPSNLDVKYRASAYSPSKPQLDVPPHIGSPVAPGKERHYGSVGGNDRVMSPTRIEGGLSPRRIKAGNYKIMDKGPSTPGKRLQFYDHADPVSGAPTKSPTMGADMMSPKGSFVHPQRPSYVPPSGARPRRHTDRPGEIGPNYDRFSPSKPYMRDRPATGLDEMNQRYRGPGGFSPGASKYDRGIGSPRTKNNFSYGMRDSSTPGYTMERDSQGRMVRKSPLVIRTGNTPLRDRMMGGGFERPSKYPNNTMSLHDDKLPNPYMNNNRGGKPRYDPIRAGRPGPGGYNGRMRDSRDPMSNPKLYNSRAMDPRAGPMRREPPESGTYRQRYGNNFSPSKNKYNKHESNKQPLKFHEAPAQVGSPTTYVPKGDDIIFGYDEPPKNPTPPRQARTQPSPVRHQPKPTPPSTRGKAPGAYIPPTDDFIFGYDDPLALDKPQAPATKTIVNTARIVSHSPLAKKTYGYEKASKEGGLTPKVTYKQLNPGKFGGLVKPNQRSNNHSKKQFITHSSSKKHHQNPYDLSSQRGGIEINSLRPGARSPLMNRTPTSKKEFSTNKKRYTGKKDSHVKPFGGGKPIEFVDSFSPSKYQQSTKRAGIRHEPTYNASPYNTQRPDQLTESRDWTSRQAFKDVNVSPPSDRLRRYSYNGLNNCFYSRICEQEYKSGSAGRDFDQYMKACREELEMAFKANDYFYDKPLKINTVRLPKVNNSKFNINSVEKRTLLIDLDETLIHSEDLIQNKNYDIVVDMAPPGSAAQDVSLIFKPQ